LKATSPFSFKEEMSVKIVFLNKLNRAWAENIEGLRKEFPYAIFVTEQNNIDHEIEDADVLVAGVLSLDVVRQARNLKMIFVPYVGFDALPLDHIKKRGIRVANIHVNAPFVAERCIAMALAFYGKVVEYHNDLKEDKKWHGYHASGSVKDTWTSIQGRTCAIIGTGAIGTHIARYLKAFDCRVIGFKKRPSEEIPACFDKITLNLREALSESELVFVTLPLTPETKGLFSAEILAGMEGKFLVNVGRGEVVDEEGLYLALKNGTLKGAGLDVWYNYPEKGKNTANPSRYPIVDLPNVILSPHIAGLPPEASAKNITATIESIKAYIRAGRAISEMNIDRMY